MNNLLLSVMTENVAKPANQQITRKLSNVILQKDVKSFPSIITKDTFSALDNYLQKQKSYVELHDLKGDLFDDTRVIVFSRKKNNEVDCKRTLMKFGDTTEKNFVEKMRTLYKFVENSIKEISQKNTSYYSRREIK